jgi:hypothetical protein
MLLTASALRAQQSQSAAEPATVRVEFTNAKLLPPHWVLVLHEDGSGEFQADKSQPTGADANVMMAGEIHRPIQLRPAFAEHVFTVARERMLFNFPCESHLKVAFQGEKQLSYSGRDGSGSCEFNYSKDKEIQALGDSLVAVGNTLIYGARLEKLLQHDRLGLDAALDNLVSAQHDGIAQEMEGIREILEKIAGDEEVLERARRRARLLLAQSR